MEKVNADILRLMPAVIDEKDIMSDAIFENIFDDGLYTDERNEALGFIVGYPAYAVVFSNTIEITPVSHNSEIHFGTLASAIVDRMTDTHSIVPLRLSKKEKIVQYISGETEPEERHIVTFCINDCRLIAQFHWNVARERK